MSERITFGGEVIEIRPLYGIQAQQTFRIALYEEIRAEALRRGYRRRPTNQEAVKLLLDPPTGVNWARLLKLGSPAITDDLLDKVTAMEIEEAFLALLSVNSAQVQQLALTDGDDWPLWPDEET